MNNFRFKFPPFIVPRVPRLYYGPSTAPVEKTGSQKLVERLFIALQVLSHLLLILGGLLGYFFYQFYGSLLLAGLGYLAGVWLRRSLGIRGAKATTGFFQRIRERAQGARPELLESLLEGLSRSPLTPAKCRTMIQVYDRAVKQLKQAPTQAEKNRILAELDRRVNQLYWGRGNPPA
jgi:hypothetical protein